MEDLTEALDNNWQLDVVYTDFAKAFDRVNHTLLLYKLANLDFSRSAVKLFESYLSDRWQKVVFNGHVSERYKAISGVPQGANLGPLLFLVFINDLPAVVNNSKYALFADDFKLWKITNSEASCYELQCDINNIYEWSQKNLLYFNINKCSTATFTKRLNQVIHQYVMNEKPIATKETITDLGVIFDKTLSFKYRIENIVNNSFRSLGFIIRNSYNFYNSVTLIKLYNTYVRSKLEYASVIWLPYYKTYIDQIEKV